MKSKAERPDAAPDAGGVPVLPPASQTRSRESLERVLDATIALLTQRGDGDFTIAEVGAAAGVAVGTVYGRVGNKESLLLALHERELERMDRETVHSLATASESGGTLDEAVGAAITARARVLAADAPLLRALIRVAEDYPAISRRGRASGLTARAAFIDTLAHVCRRFDLDVTDDDLAWADEVTFAVATRQLGIGLADRSAPMREFPLDALATRLARTVAAYLRSAAGGRPGQERSP